MGRVLLLVKRLLPSGSPLRRPWSWSCGAREVDLRLVRTGNKVLLPFMSLGEVGCGRVSAEGVTFWRLKGGAFGKAY